MEKESSLNALYRLYDRETDKKQKEQFFNKLLDEIYVLTYALGIKAPNVGLEKASELLLMSCKNFKRIIGNYKDKDVVDFAYYIKQSINHEILNYIRFDKNRNDNDKTLFAISNLSYECSEDDRIGAIKDEDKIVPCKNNRNYKLLSNKSIAMYIAYISTRMNNEFVREMASGMDLEQRLFYINNVIRFRKAQKTGERYDVSKRLSKLYYFRKVKSWIKEYEEGENEIDDKNYYLRYNRLKEKHDNISKQSHKVPYKEVADAYGIKDTSVGKYFIYAKDVLKEKYKEIRSR